MARVPSVSQANRGRWVEFDRCDYGLSNTAVGANLEALRSRWGLDVRTWHGSRPGHYGTVPGCRWLLAGEWFGKVYVDYTQEENR